MARFTKEMEIEIFVAACKFIRARSDFGINDENFPIKAARAFRMYRNFMEAANNDTRRKSKV